MRVVLLVVSVSCALALAQQEGKDAAVLSRQKREPPIIVHSYPKRRPKPVYGPPRPKPVYGPPKPKYGPPKPKYGPPKPVYGPPKPKYGPPKPVYGPPKPKYGPPKPVYGPPKSKYGPPKSKYGPPKMKYGPPSQSYGEPPMSFGGLSSYEAPLSGNYGEPPISSYEAPLSTSYGSPPLSSYGAPSSSYGAPSSSYGTPSSFYGGPPSSSYGVPAYSASEPVGSFGAPKKIYNPPPKPYDHYSSEGGFSAYEGSPEDSSGEFGSFSPNYNTKSGSSKYGSRTQPHDSYGLLSEPQSSYEASSSSYGDSLPPSDYFGAPMAPTSSGYDSSGEYDSYIDHWGAFSSKKIVKQPLPSRKEEPRPSSKNSRKKGSKSRNRTKSSSKPQPSIPAITVGGGKYAEPPSKAIPKERDSSVYGTTYTSSNKQNPFSLEPVESQYVNYKGSNMGFSPQNVNDVFTANKRHETTIDIVNTDVAESQVKNVIIVRSADDPDPSDVTLSKSLSHSYYAGSAPDPFYAQSKSEIEAVPLSPNYFTASGAAVKIADKSSQRTRDITPTDIRRTFDESISTYEDKIQNHRL